MNKTKKYELPEGFKETHSWRRRGQKFIVAESEGSVEVFVFDISTGELRHAISLPW